MKTRHSLAFTAAFGISLLTVRGAAQTHFTTLYGFTGSPDGATPQGLVSGPHGVLYGVTAYGGDSGFGTVFQLSPPASPGGTWTETVIYAFTDRDDGANPFAAPVVGPGGVLYGTTQGGGADGLGTIYELQPPPASGGTWTEIPLYTSYGEDGDGYGYRGVAMGASGEIYGVTSGGGIGNGVVFELTPPSAPGGTWTLTNIYSFPSRTDGSNPTGLTISPDGSLYGTTTYGGTFGAGTVFALTPESTPGEFTYSVLYNFTGGADGAAPLQPATLAGGILYGTTSAGGSANCGVVFELTPPAESGGAWTETTLFSFGGGDGKLPDSPVVLWNGTIYGTTLTGTDGRNRGGSVFELQPPAASGSPWIGTVLHEFGGEAEPYGNMFVDKSGAIYGVTTNGPSSNGAGSVYRIKL